MNEYYAALNTLISPAFQGVSVFIGVLLSLGSTSFISNIVAGVVLTYANAFKYTSHPAQIVNIYSDLHQNIQNYCKQAGMEIMIPHYRAVRDGKQTTIPNEQRT